VVEPISLSASANPSAAQNIARPQRKANFHPHHREALLNQPKKLKLPGFEDSKLLQLAPNVQKTVRDQQDSASTAYADHANLFVPGPQKTEGAPRSHGVGQSQVVVSSLPKDMKKLLPSDGGEGEVVVSSLRPNSSPVRKYGVKDKAVVRSLPKVTRPPLIHIKTPHDYQVLVSVTEAPVQRPPPGYYGAAKPKPRKYGITGKLPHESSHNNIKAPSQSVLPTSFGSLKQGSVHDYGPPQIHVPVEEPPQHYGVAQVLSPLEYAPDVFYDPAPAAESPPTQTYGIPADAPVEESAVEPPLNGYTDYQYEENRNQEDYIYDDYAEADAPKDSSGTPKRFTTAVAIAPSQLRPDTLYGFSVPVRSPDSSEVQHSSSEQVYSASSSRTSRPPRPVNVDSGLQAERPRRQQKTKKIRDRINQI
jgi:hypothetical protein